MFGLLATVVAACASPDEGGKGKNKAGFDNNPPLSEAWVLYEGWPGNDKLADEGKADAVYPAKFDAPMQWQSPIRNQSGRGVCSIFSAIGLMEHLYIKEGTITEPDFSEQFLQWSVKVEVGAFPTSEGSSSSYNLRAISSYGVVEEEVYPYVRSAWGVSDDPACEGDDQPTRCHTQGDPPESVLSAERWHLPSGRWISSRRDSIKAHMVSTEQAVVVGGDFFYQAWNHGGSDLVTSDEYFANGYVTYPNDADREQDPAGHSFVLVGWDDDLEVQERDGEGNLLFDDNGDPIMEKGFFLFRNSWGTGSFGTRNPYGAGYGWISMRYVEEFLTAYVSGLPEVDLYEDCGDATDNDHDDLIDCDDSDCSTDPACTQGAVEIHTYDQSVSIPDNDPNGVELDLDVRQDGIIQAMSVTVDISHTYSGDLLVELLRDGGQAVTLHANTGGGADDVKRTYTVTDWEGLSADAIYTLRVVDSAGQDVGTVNSWSVEIKTGGQSNTGSYDAYEDAPIPDNDATGIFSNIDVNEGGAIRSMKAVVTIDHPYKGDLTLRLQKVGAPGEAVLVEADARDGQFGTQSFVVNEFLGDDAAGTWRLTVSDHAAQDVGTLKSWSLEIGR
jgi:subtilisin-like proprotein convertase family protein